MKRLTAELVVGSETFPMVLAAERGVQQSPLLGGVGPVKWTPHQYEEPTTLDDMLFTERWNLVVHSKKGSDELATMMRRLILVLRRAWAYHNKGFYTTPVYLRARAKCETGYRYALVYQSPGMEAPWPQWDAAFEQAGAVNPYSVTISRFVWTAGPPGVLPDCTQLDWTHEYGTVEGLCNGDFELVPGVKATGGTVTYAGGKTIHTFTSGGNFVVTSPGDVEYLILGGGGGGGSSHGGGGGAGALKTGTTAVAIGSLPVVVGAGGARGANPDGPGGDGGSSSFNGITGIGGGGGGCYSAGRNGRTGGSGGGASFDGTVGVGTDGNDGGLGSDPSQWGGGGGGAAEDGYAASAGGDGGAGLASSITGVSLMYAAGGGGGQVLGDGGSDIGGDGKGAHTSGEDAPVANRGSGGGGGGSYQDHYGGLGSDGVVIISYTPGATGGDTFPCWWDDLSGTATAAIEDTIVHGGLYSLKLTAGTGAAWNYQDVSVNPGKTYMLSIWSYGDGVNAGRFAVYDNTNAAYIIAATSTGNTAAAWARTTQAFTTPAGCYSIRVYLGSANAAGIAYFDDVTLTFTVDDPVVGTSLACTGHVANYQDNHAITSIYNYDDSADTYLGNLCGVAAHDYFYVANPVAVDDCIYFGGDETFFTLAGYTGVAGLFVWTIVPEYWDGGAWTALAMGTEYTMWPSTITNCLSRVGHWQFNFVPPSDWAAIEVNGETKYWLRWRISAFTSTTILPENAEVPIYNVHSSHIDVPASALKGDGPPYALLRISKPYGTPVSTPDLGTTSRVIIGSKSRGLDGFTAFLNCGGDGNPAEWVTTQGTDATATADATSPGGDASVIDFATLSTMQMRVRFVGTDVLPDYKGKYRVFVRCLQTGAGAAGDIQLKVRLRINGAADTDPVWETSVVPTCTDDYMVLDMTPGGFIKLPFGDEVDADILTLADLVVEVHAERLTGSDTLTLYDVVLMPCDEWIADIDDPLTDTTTGASALRGYSMLEVDSGIIADRTIKEVLDYGASLTNPPIYYAETWARRSAPMRLPVGRKCRLFFLNERYLTNYTDGELYGLGAMGLVVELYLQPIYYYLRGDD